MSDRLEDAEPPRRVGRPSIQGLRRTQIVDAFIALVGEYGLEAVSLDAVAEKAGVQRAAIRHFVGNRGDLVAAAVEEITTRAVADLGEPTPFTRLAPQLFSAKRYTKFSAETSAWIALLPEALRLSHGPELIRASWERLITTIAKALELEHPEATAGRIRDTAYAIACMSEQDFSFQSVGFPRARSKAAMDAALALAADLDSSDPSKGRRKSGQSAGALS